VDRSLSGTELMHSSRSSLSREEYICTLDRQPRLLSVRYILHASSTMRCSLMSVGSVSSVASSVSCLSFDARSKTLSLKGSVFGLPMDVDILARLVVSTCSSRTDMDISYMLER